MIKDYKSFLKLKYGGFTARDLQHEKFEVKEIAWINVGIGEQPDDRGNLKVVDHPDCAFVRFTIDPKQQPRLVSYTKKRQATSLRIDLLTTLRQELRPIREDVKQLCLNLARKYWITHRFWERSHLSTDAQK